MRLTQVRESGGATSLVDVRQAEQLVYGAGARITDSSGRIEQQENFLSVLPVGFPGAIARGRALTEQPHAPELPTGLPSALLERRPDIQQAEQETGRRQRGNRRRPRQLLPADCADRLGRRG